MILMILMLSLLMIRILVIIHLLEILNLVMISAGCGIYYYPTYISLQDAGKIDTSHTS